MKKNKNRNNGASTVNTSNELITTTVTHKQEKLAEVEENLNIQKEEIITAEDKAAMADQCYHYKMACELGTCNSTMSKFAVFYRNRWFFCIYKRDDNKVSSIIPTDILTSAEYNRFMMFKNRMENDQRIARMNTAVAKAEVIK